MSHQTSIRLLIVSLLFLALESTAQEHSYQVIVDAKTFPNHSGIQVEKGEVYTIEAKGEWQDADFPPTDANGFKGFTAPMFFGMLLKPLPSQFYMKLCGKVEGFKFPIGTKTTVEMKRSGELQLFANDAKGFFDNNSGTIIVTINKVE